MRENSNSKIYAINFNPNLVKYIKNYAAIGEKYVEILEGIITKNSLTDFDKAGLLPTKLKTGVAL